MQEEVKCFTAENVGRGYVLITACGISSPFDPASQIGDPPERSHFEAVWDTGATMTSISSEVVRQCGLKPHTMTVSHTASGMCSTPVYKINITLINGVNFHNLNVAECILPAPTNVLIGMDIIGAGDFAVSNKDGKTVFSYRHPSISTIDFVQEMKNKNERVQQRKVIQLSKSEGNKPCYCGSKKKFKYCHAKLAG